MICFVILVFKLGIVLNGVINVFFLIIKLIVFDLYRLIILNLNFCFNILLVNFSMVS